jgi:LEA14-like dessication related protein
MIMRAMRTVAFLSAVLALSACVGMSPKLQAPRLTVVGANMISGDVFSQQFRVRLHVENPNDRALPVKSLEYKLFLQGDSFAEGTSLAAFTVPANGEKEFDLNVTTNFVSSIGRLLAHLNGSNSSKIEYAIAGQVQVDAAFSPKLKFTETGVVDLGRK